MASHVVHQSQARAPCGQSTCRNSPTAQRRLPCTASQRTSLHRVALVLLRGGVGEARGGNQLVAHANLWGQACGVAVWCLLGLRGAEKGCAGVRVPARGTARSQWSGCLMRARRWQATSACGGRGTCCSKSSCCLPQTRRGPRVPPPAPDPEAWGAPLCSVRSQGGGDPRCRRRRLPPPPLPPPAPPQPAHATNQAGPTAAAAAGRVSSCKAARGQAWGGEAWEGETRARPA